MSGEIDRREEGGRRGRGLSISEKIIHTWILLYIHKYTSLSLSLYIYIYIPSHLSLCAFVVRSLLSSGVGVARAGVDVGDHPPITPLRGRGEDREGVLSGDMGRLYDMITRHFIATLSHDARYGGRGREGSQQRLCCVGGVVCLCTRCGLCGVVLCVILYACNLCMYLCVKVSEHQGEAVLWGGGIQCQRTGHDPRRVPRCHTRSQGETHNNYKQLHIYTYIHIYRIHAGSCRVPRCHPRGKGELVGHRMHDYFLYRKNSNMSTGYIYIYTFFN
jgi:hypothetical protein